MNNFISMGEYLKQLRIQKFYATKFHLNYASSWLKYDIESYIKSLDHEIEIYEDKLSSSKDFIQTRLSL